MNLQEIVKLKRDCEAVEIPSGKKMSFFGGTELYIMQSLGGAFTVMTHQSQMASIAGKDADALGKEIPPEAAIQSTGDENEPVDKQVWAKLKTCYDPEIPHNIVDLGLVYNCDITPNDEGEYLVAIKMTLTAPGCGMGEWLRQDVRTKLLLIPKVKEAQVEVVFEPPWDRSKMHPALRREFN